MEKNVMRLLAVQHLRTVCGIKTKNWSKTKAASCKTTSSNSVSKPKFLSCVDDLYIYIFNLHFNICIYRFERVNELVQLIVCLGRTVVSRLNSISIKSLPPPTSAICL